MNESETLNRSFTIILAVHQPYSIMLHVTYICIHNASWPANRVKAWDFLPHFLLCSYRSSYPHWVHWSWLSRNVYISDTWIYYTVLQLSLCEQCLLGEVQLKISSCFFFANSLFCIRFRKSWTSDIYSCSYNQHRHTR